MPSQKGKSVAPRKRNRKRKRRVASPTSSSSSSSSSGSESETKTTRPLTSQPLAKEPSSSESSPETSSDSDSEGEVVPATSASKPGVSPKVVHSRHASPSPSPPQAKLPSFIPPSGIAESINEQQDQTMKNRFRKFWMASIADGFREDLEEIRKEPNFGGDRLSLLIDSLASGASVFATSSPSKEDIDEVNIILE